ncbi:Mu transposase domain-containing protein, partial [Serinicoccus sp. CUA-874]|uniref:Mu transposase domain-containing protein n=1 Tax=Serinicoccus sp. CUA-874 TaxID=1517939 RepID=UPI000A8E3398
GATAYLLVGALAHSGRWRGVLCPSMDQPHLIDALDRVARALGGLTRSWRFDRMATVCHPATGRVSASFSAVAKHYAVGVDICPPRRGNRKGVVEKANHTAAQRWWRTLPEETTVEQAQASLDRFCATRGDARLRPAGPGGKASVLTLAAREPLAPVPAVPFPATISEDRTVSAQALVSWRGNFYSVAPELARAQVSVTWRLGTTHIDIATSAGTVIARHELAPDGAGVMVREHAHVTALEARVLAPTTPEHRTDARNASRPGPPPAPPRRCCAPVTRTTTRTTPRRPQPAGTW